MVVKQPRAYNQILFACGAPESTVLNNAYRANLLRRKIEAKPFYSRKANIFQACILSDRYYTNNKDTSTEQDLSLAVRRLPNPTA